MSYKKMFFLFLIFLFLFLLFSNSNVYSASLGGAFDVNNFWNTSSKPDQYVYYTDNTAFPSELSTYINLGEVPFFIKQNTGSSLTNVQVLDKGSRVAYSYTNRLFYVSSDSQSWSATGSGYQNFSNIKYVNTKTDWTSLATGGKVVFYCDVYDYDALINSGVETIAFQYNSDITNTAEDLAFLENNVVITAGYDIYNSTVTFLVLHYLDDELDDYEIVYSSLLNTSNGYYRKAGTSEYFDFPYQVILGENGFVDGDLYEFRILVSNPVPEIISHSNSISQVFYNVGVYDPNNPIVPDNPDDGTNAILDAFAGLNSSLEKQTEAINKQTEQQKEDNKGIIETIKQVIGFINPLSENFFVYKLIDLLLDLLIKVFVPSSEFFSEWFADLNEYFGDRFGMLYYPFELVVDILNRVKGLTANLNGNFVLKTPNLDVLRCYFNTCL